MSESHHRWSAALKGQLTAEVVSKPSKLRCPGKRFFRFFTTFRDGGKERVESAVVLVPKMRKELAKCLVEGSACYVDVE